MKPITTREKQVLTMIAGGLTTRQAAIQLGISIHTAHAHRKNLLKKFDAHNAAELINKAMLLKIGKTGERSDWNDVS